MKNEYLSVIEVAKLMRKTPYTIRKWCRNKKIKAIKVGGEKGEWYINVENFRS